MRIPSIIFLILTASSCASTSNDSRNETLAKKLIKNSHSVYKSANFEVTSFNGIALITGQVPSADLIPIATAEVEKLRNVRRVHNELRVAGSTSMIARTNDSWLTAKVNSAFASSEETDTSRIKVVTENGVVFLIGLLSRTEADAAVDIARQTKGVQKIVKLLEYID